MLEQMNPRDAILMSCLDGGGAVAALQKRGAVRSIIGLGRIGQAAPGPQVCAERGESMERRAVYQVPDGGAWSNTSGGLRITSSV